MSTIILRKLQFSNVMTFGENVEIDLAKYKVLQLIGVNGVGKSTIATVLEELLYNKNSRGIKKDDLLSWDADKKEYNMYCSFSKDEDLYEVNKVVKSTAKLTLTKNGEDISGHTATQTYKLIEEILGSDFSTFTKLIYQSIGSSLDFLKATDANRKAFLVNLFKQDSYALVSDKVKAAKKAIDIELNKLEGALSIIQDTLKSPVNETLPEFVEVPQYELDVIRSRITQIKVDLALEESNTKILDKKAMFDAELIEVKDSLSKYFPAPTDPSEELQKVTRELTENNYQREQYKKQFNELKKSSEVHNCPTCGTELDVSGIQESMAAIKVKHSALKPVVDRLTEEQSTLKEAKSIFDVVSRLRAKSISLERSIEDLPQVKETRSIVGSTDLTEEAKKLEKELVSKVSEIELATNHNIEVDKVRAVALAQSKRYEEARTKLAEVKDKLSVVEQKSADYTVLVAILKNIVGYKLESSVKTFEDLINKYLSVLTSGKFALGFELDDSKLKVIIYNDGNKTNIESCSTGQQGRINLSTLLAIRMLMSSISSININLLFLDEVVSFLDKEGMSTLIDILNNEPELNSIIVSHGYSHPLTNKVQVCRGSDNRSFLLLEE